MDSPQSVVSPFKGSSLLADPERQKADLFARNASCLSAGTEVQSKAVGGCNSEAVIGVLDVFVHQARDIHNICIYHKQDVYAKLCLTSDPDNSVSTQIINGGGKNPIFNENLRLKVRTVECSLKCEVWMLSRVRNYLEDQLLGFALVPLSEVLMKNGKVEKEFSLSSTDLFHSPAGFVHLSLCYAGTSPEVMELPAVFTSVAESADVRDSEIQESLPGELDKIEFPDPKVVNENQMMVSEYFGISSANLDSQTSESSVSSDTENQVSSEIGVRLVESFNTGAVDSAPLLSHESPPSSVSTNGSASVSAFPTASIPASTQSCGTPGASKSQSQECISPLKENAKEKGEDVGDAESNASGGEPVDAITKPVISVKVPEPKVVQQDIVNMYMKSMQQFTESLAKMRLPMDVESGPMDSGNSSSDQNLQANKNTGSRVFYGSRAFF